MKLYYDFHIHSCLSPCGDADSTPNNIVNMALVKGLHVIAPLRPQHGQKLPRGHCRRQKKNGLVVLPAMELTTSEDIHILCLFERYEDLQKLEAHIQKTRLRIKNKPEIFGRQLILNENDEIVGEEEDLLIVSSGVSVEDAAALVGGVRRHRRARAYRQAGERADRRAGRVRLFPRVPHGRMRARDDVTLPRITDSDAHYIWDISEPEHFIEAESCSARGVFAALKRMCADGK